MVGHAMKGSIVFHFITKMSHSSLQSLEYEKEGKTQQVYFWHLVGGRAYSYKQNDGHNIFAALIDIRSYGLDLRKEQFFIRLSSNTDIISLKKMPAFGTILEALATLGLNKKMQAPNTTL